jgi:hypothetical protein
MSGWPEEITREYRLEFNTDEALWDEPIAPETSSTVLARRVTHALNRTSLLAWSLMNISSVEVADVTGNGWIEIRISTGSDFDEGAFKAEVANALARVRQVESAQSAGSMFRSSPRRQPFTNGLLCSPLGATPALTGRP